MIKYNLDLIATVPSFGDHKCQGNSKITEYLEKDIKLLKGIFLTKAKKSVLTEWVWREVSGPFLSINGYNFNSSVPSLDLTLFVKWPSLSTKIMQCMSIYIYIPNDCSATRHLPSPVWGGVRAMAGELMLQNCPPISKTFLIGNFWGFSLHIFIVLDHYWKDSIKNSKRRRLYKCSMYRIFYVIGHNLCMYIHDTVTGWQRCLCASVISYKKSAGRILASKSSGSFVI